MLIAELLAGSKNLSLALFPDDTVKKVESRFALKNNKPVIECFVRRKQVPAKPEELVRQLLIAHLNLHFGYDLGRIAVEHPITFGRDSSKRADIVIFDADRPTVPYCIIEVKAPHSRAAKTSSRAMRTPPAHRWRYGATVLRQ